MRPQILISFILIVIISAVVLVWLSASPDDNSGDWRADWQPLRYVAVREGVLYDCPSVGCLELATFEIGTAFTIIGAVGRDGAMWYVVAVEDDVAFVQVWAVQYKPSENMTPMYIPMDGGGSF